MLPVGHCQVPPLLRPLQAETTVVGSQRGFVVGLYARLPRDKSRLLTVVRPALIPYRFLICAIKARALKKRSCRTILSNARSCRGVVFRGAPEDLPGTKDPVAACLLSMQLTVARIKPTRAAIAPCLMPSRASATTSWLIPIGVGRGIVRTIRNTFEKICKYWFKDVTVWRLIWGNDHLYCGFGARRSHLTLHWMSDKVVSDFVGEQSRVHIMPISAKWKHKSLVHIGFIVFNGGVTTFFAKSVSSNNSYNPVTGQIVPAELNMHHSVHFDDAMERQSPRWNHWILWSHMHSD